MKHCDYCGEPAARSNRLCSQCISDSRPVFTKVQKEWLVSKLLKVAQSLSEDDTFDSSIRVALTSIIFKVQHGRQLSDHERALATDFVNVLLITHERLIHRLDITGEEVYRKLTGLDRHTQSGPPFFNLYAGIL